MLMTGIAMMPAKYLACISCLFMAAALSSLSSSVLAKEKHHHHKRHHHARHVTQAKQGHPVRGEQALSAEILAAIAESGFQTPVGIEIRSMKYGDTLYSKNPGRLFTPASTLKILTAEAALIFLGPDYHFTTRALTNAKSVNDGVLAGDLWLIHSGDPSLTWYDLNDLMVALKAQQIRSIQGNVYIDNTAYDQENIGPGWLWKDRQYCYAAPINASIVNHNCVTFSIVPARKERQRALVIESPRYFYADIRNTVVTRSSHAKSCHVTVTKGPDNAIDLEGCLPKGHYARTASVVVADISKNNEAMMKQLLRMAKIRFGGTIQTAVLPAPSSGLHPLVVHASRPLHELIGDMLKKSDNVIAGSLFKKLGQLRSGQPGSWKNGSLAVSDILQKKAGVKTDQMAVLDGSGLSPDNKITPEQMMAVLDFAFHHDSSSYEFISSLPVAGMDGTLKHRLQQMSGRIRAKTGTMPDAGVSSLAGYAVSRDHEPLAFVIIVNGNRGNVWKYRVMEDRIAMALANFSRKG